MAAEHIARIGDRIRARREELDLTQRELADQIPGKADGNQVSKWERGVHQAGADTLEQLAKALDVDVSYFLTAEPEPGGSPDLLGVFDTANPAALDALAYQLDELALMLEATGTPRPSPADVARRAALRMRAQRREDPPSQDEPKRSDNSG